MSRLHSAHMWLSPDVGAERRPTVADPGALLEGYLVSELESADRDRFESWVATDAARRLTVAALRHPQDGGMLSRDDADIEDWWAQCKNECALLAANSSLARSICLKPAESCVSGCRWQLPPGGGRHPLHGSPSRRRFSVPGSCIPGASLHARPSRQPSGSRGACVHHGSRRARRRDARRRHGRAGSRECPPDLRQLRRP